MQLVALITALAALWLSTWAVLTTRLTARMSALPLLHPFQESDAQRVTRPNAVQLVSGHLSAQLINGGLGPAIVTRYEAFADGVLIDLRNDEQVQTLLTTVFGLNGQNAKAKWFSFEGAIAVPKDGSIPCLLLKFSVPTYDDAKSVAEGLQHLRLRVEYQSIYGDELLFEGEKAPIPPRLSLFRKRKRVRAAMLATKRRRFWFVMSVGWIALWICFLLVTLNQQSPFDWYTFFIVLVWFGLAPVALIWGLVVAVPATLRWIRAGKQ